MPTVDNTNSYVTEAEATAHFAERLYVDTWDDADTADQQKALIMAAKLLDNHIVWQGWKTDDDQSRQWPRIGVTGVALDVVPGSVQIAQMELALILLDKNTLAMPDNPGVKSQKVDSIAQVFFEGGNKPKVIPDTVFELVAAYGRRACGLGSISLTR